MNPPDVVADLSILELFKHAHIVVKLVIVGLLLASIWSWAIILEKLFLYAKTRKETDKFEQVFWSGQSLEELYNALAQRRNTGMAALFVAAMREWKRSTERESGDKTGRPMPGVQLRVEKVMDVTISREVERLERRLTFLATVGSTAPFIGLFGTVWGIMTSFQAIAVSRNTSLAVVAPGIAEALFATALGLLAAIPAVIFYNKFNSEVARHAARRGSAAPMSEINVTPMVDVMLVLLIIFMVTAPMLTAGIEVVPQPDLPKVNLPKTEARPIDAQKQALAITVNPEGKVFLQSTE